jgi:hypothetical protein
MFAWLICQVDLHVSTNSTLPVWQLHFTRQVSKPHYQVHKAELPTPHCQCHERPLHPKSSNCQELDNLQAAQLLKCIPLLLKLLPERRRLLANIPWLPDSRKGSNICLLLLLLWGGF